MIDSETCCRGSWCADLHLNRHSQPIRVRWLCRCTKKRNSVPINSFFFALDQKRHRKSLLIVSRSTPTIFHCDADLKKSFTAHALHRTTITAKINSFHRPVMIPDKCICISIVARERHKNAKFGEQ